MTAVRAFVAVAMLVGFYLLAVAQLLVAFVLLVGLSAAIANAVGFAVYLNIGAGTVLAGLVYGTWRALRGVKALPPVGVRLRRDSAPELWAVVRELAAAVQTRPPDEIWLVAQVNAAVTEDTRLLGLVGGRRRLVIGLPLLHGLTVSQLRAVLAHELGHYSLRHTRLTAVAYRGHLAVATTIRQISAANPMSWTLKLYARLFLLVQRSVSRRQERDADLAAVRLAGRGATASALRELRVIADAYRFFATEYVGPGPDTGIAPADLFGGFAQLLAARVDELDQLRATQPADEPRSAWRTHPPLPQRLATIAKARQRAEPPQDRRPAVVLVPQVADAGRRLQTLAALFPESCALLPWPEYLDRLGTLLAERFANDWLVELSERAGHRISDLAGMFELIELDGFDAIIERLFAPVLEADRSVSSARQLFVPVLRELVVLAALRSRIAGWRTSFGDPMLRLVDLDGRPIDVEYIAGTAVDPQTVPDARQLLVLHRIHGKAPLRTRPKSAQQPTATVLGGIINADLDRQPVDLVLLDSGFIVLPKKRYTTSVIAKNQLRETLNQPPPALRKRAGSRVIRYADVQRASRSGLFGRTHRLRLRDGTEAEVRFGTFCDQINLRISDSSFAIFKAAMKSLAGQSTR